MRILAALILCILPAVNTLADTPEQSQKVRRYLLDEEFSWVDRVGADRYIATAKRAGFNVLVPCVWHGRGATWRTSLPREPRWMDKRTPLPDPLGYLIERAHAEGLEVHPWFTLVKRQRDFYPEFLDPGVPDDAFDVHNEDFRKFIQNVVLEVVRNYPVDGINLDYVRSRGVCLSDRCREDYARRTGRNLRVDNLAHRASDDARTSIGNWNAQAVEDLVVGISTGVRAARPEVILSVSSHAAYTPLFLEGTNSISWANKGWIDYILHIEYAQVPNMRRDLLEVSLRTLQDPSRLVMIAGNYEFEKGNKSNVWSRDADEVGKSISFAATFNPAQAGAALYEYRFLTDAQVDAIARSWPESRQLDPVRP